MRLCVVGCLLTLTTGCSVQPGPVRDPLARPTTDGVRRLQLGPVQPGYWIEWGLGFSTDSRLAVVGETPTAWLVEFMPGWKSLPEPYGGFALLVQKTDGNVLQAWLAGSGTPQAAAVESVYDFTVDREYANPLSSARFQERIQEELTEGEQFDLLSLVWLRCTHTRVEVGEPQAGPYGTLECELSEVQLEFSGDGYDGDPAEAPKLHFATGGARRAWTAPGTPLGRLRLRFEQEVTVGTNATPRWTVHERRQLVRQARGQTRVGSVWVEGWELTYTHRKAGARPAITGWAVTNTV